MSAEIPVDEREEAASVEENSDSRYRTIVLYITLVTVIHKC